MPAPRPVASPTKRENTNDHSTPAAPVRRVNENQLTFDLPEPLLELLAERVARRVIERLEQPEPSPWMDLNAAAAYLGFSRDRLYKLTAAGAIPCRRQPGGQRLIFRRDELDHWLETAWECEGFRG